MNERAAGQVGIEQGGLRPQLVQGNQRGQVFDTVFQHHTDSIAAHQAKAPQRAGVAVGVFVEFSPGKFPALKNNSSVQRIPGRGGLDSRAEAVAGAQGTRLYFPGEPRQDPCFGQGGGHFCHAHFYVPNGRG